MYLAKKQEWRDIMPRKSKNIYQKIKEKEEQIETTKEKLETYEKELIQLNKERESLEMKQIFDTAKEHDMSFQQVIELISKSHNIK